METERHRVLVVDDDEATLEAAKLALATGFHVETHRSPTQALQRLRESDFHVLCVGQSLPGTSGTEMYEKTRGLARAVACVILVGPGETAPNTSAAGNEMLSVLDKPFDPSRLARLVEQLARLALIQRNLQAHARPSSRGIPLAARPPSGAQAIANPRPISGDFDAVRPREKSNPSVTLGNAEPGAARPPTLDPDPNKKR